MTALRLPPNGPELAERLRAGKCPPILVVAAGPAAWVLAHDEVDEDRLLILPPDEVPEAFDWSIVRGHDCLVIERNTPRALLDQLVAVLLEAGAPLVLLHTEFDTPLEYLDSYRPAAIGAAA